MTFQLNRGGLPQFPPNAPLFLIVPGAGLALFGLLVLFNPDLIRWMVGGLFLVVGGLMLFAGMRARKMLG
jgi:uncharacterized membrane protein